MLACSTFILFNMQLHVYKYFVIATYLKRFMVLPRNLQDIDPFQTFKHQNVLNSFGAFTELQN